MVVEENPEELIVNCYRMAQKFAQSPEVFLNMPISRFNAHLYYTVRMMEAENRARRRRDDDDD